MFVLERHFLEKSFDFVESNNPLLYNADLIFAASVTKSHYCIRMCQFRLGPSPF